MKAAQTVRERERAHLRAVADRIRSEKAGRALCRRAAEWLAMPLVHRMALLMLAGVDGDLPALARRAWPEFSGPEKIAVQVAIRAMKTSLEAAYALSVRAG